ncbi:MAG: DUF6259 domain-containing protein [Candidatus Hydrogenedentota bacterium]
MKNSSIHARIHASLVAFWVGGFVCAAAVAEEARETIVTPRLKAEFEDGILVGLSEPDGQVFASFDDTSEFLRCLHRMDVEIPVGAAKARQVEDIPGGKAWSFSGFEKLRGTRLRTAVAVDGDELTIRQEAECPQKQLWGAEWSIQGIPLDYNVIVPGRSGVRLTTETPGSSYVYDYPRAWEAQLVVVEGENSGFYVWARDPDIHFKRLIVDRKPSGWQLHFISMAYAPFEENDAIISPEWRLGAYTGDWRVPARRYRDWMVRHFKPVHVEKQKPRWVKDIRCCVIMGLDLGVLENLGKTLDPTQTIVYVPSWRAQGYDRDYPDYDEVIEGVHPFIERAHALGFKVMLHVNYFGVDPLNPLYEQFEPYQVRSPWDDHKKQWWSWTRAEPDIRFAYINPACEAWRNLFVDRMARLCADYNVDALHLDQTLCIYNDHNGRIDGMTMAEGNIALHKQLREALPGVALSGEGLNEVTYRHEAFAQRHAYGLRHAEGVWDRPSLLAAHPICSYLFRPFTIINGYLGCAPPTSGQLYAAWNEAYEHWGVIPTLKPSSGKLDSPDGFVHQFRDELMFWFEARPEIAMDDPWPDTVAFPYRAATGERVVRTIDHRLLAGERVISHTISGVDEVALPGTIPGWRAYDATRLFGLDPEAWYPYFDDPRDLSAPHLASLPEGFRPTSIIFHDEIGIMRTEQCGGWVKDIARMLDDAVRGSRHLDGSDHPFEANSPSPDGAFFQPHGNVIRAHPPWKTATGIAYARLDIALPESGNLSFEAAVGMDEGAVGQTDGVTFSVLAEAGSETLEEAVHTASSEPVPLELDLTPFAGQTVALELAVHPGPEKNPSFDWARWYNARILHRLHETGTVKLGGAVSYTHAAFGGKLVSTRVTDPGLAVDVPMPGALYFVGKTPTETDLPLDLASKEFTVVFADALGSRLNAPRHATARPDSGRVGETAVTGLFVHPPNKGQTILVYTMTLPPTPGMLETSVGLRDGAEESNGVECIIEVNGLEMTRIRVSPGDGLLPLQVGLARWAGKPIVLTLITDSAGPYICDWVMWNSPRIREAP